MRNFRPALTYYNADLSPAQFYYFEKGLFPLAYCEIQMNAAGWMTDLEVKDSRWDLEYRLPPLRTMSLRLARQAANPNHGFRGEIEVQTEDRICVLDASDSRELLLSLSGLLQKYDPVLLVSEYGDSFILPKLLTLSNRYGIPLPLNRDTKQVPLAKKAYSYASYGDLYIHLDNLYRQTGRIENRRKLLTEILKITPLREDLRKRSIQIMVETGQYDQALLILAIQKFVPLEMDQSFHQLYVQALQQTAEDELRQGKVEDAIQTFQMALEFPENHGVGKPYTEQNADILYQLGCPFER